MKIGLLICDHIQEDLLHIQGSYDNMYSDMLYPYESKAYFVCDGIFPDSPEDCDAWLVGGSKYSVYEDLDWIIALKKFVKKIYKYNLPYVGLCFGHQLLAESLGGKVYKAENGWCLGSHTFVVKERKSWMSPYSERVNVLMLCQDQISSLPSDSSVLASSEDCPVAMFSIGDHMLGIQGHPEFTKEFKRGIINARRERYGNEMTDKALSTLHHELHHDKLTEWITEFLTNAHKS